MDVSSDDEIRCGGVAIDQRSEKRRTATGGETLRSGDETFLRRLGIILLVVALAFLSWKLSHFMLLVFAAVLVATVLRSLGDLIGRVIPLPRAWRPPLALLLLVALLAGGAMLFGAEIENQLTQLISQLPQAASTLVERIRASPLAGALPWNEISSTVAGYIPGIGTLVVSTLADIVLVVIAGVFFAIDTDLYRRGAVMLLPHDWRPRVDDALETSGVALQHWLRGQIVLMVFVGVTTAVGLWLIGVPSYLGLGLIAGLAEFIPYLGPFIGAFPAILIALGTDWQTAAWTAGLFFLVQQVENYLLQPYVANRTVSVPPALGLFAVIAFGTLFGGMGLVLAVPLTVVTMVMMTKLYLQPELGEDVSAPGEPDKDAA